MGPFHACSLLLLLFPACRAVRKADVKEAARAVKRHVPPQQAMSLPEKNGGWIHRRRRSEESSTTESPTSAGNGVTENATDEEPWCHLVDIVKMDSFGDGWNGATMDIRACNGTLLEAGITMNPSGSEAEKLYSETEQRCLPDAFVVSVSGGEFPAEVTWEIRSESTQTLMLDGKAGVSTDNCLRFNSTENRTDNRTDLYHQCDVVEVRKKDDYGNGWDGGQIAISTCDGTLIKQGLTLNDGAEGTEELCLPETFRVSAVEGDWPDEASWEIWKRGTNTRMLAGRLNEIEKDNCVVA